MNNVEKVIYAREAAHVKRCHTWETIRQNTVGFHTHGAVSIYLILCPEPKLEVVKVLQFHDYAERLMGDLPAPTKIAHPDLKSIYERIEKEELDRLGLFGEISAEDAKWVRACDVLDFYLFAYEELYMGNQRVKQRFDQARRMLDESPDTPKEIREFMMGHNAHRGWTEDFV